VPAEVVRHAKETAGEPEMINYYSEPDFRAVTGTAFRIPPDRPDILLLELRTAHGPFRFGMTQSLALKIAEDIRERAELLKTVGSSN
jgi:hypothetical protein